MSRRRQDTRKRTAALESPDADASQAVFLLVLIAATIATVAGLLLFAAPASALSFQLEFRTSTYQTVAGDTYDSLVLQHQSGTLLSSQTVDAIDGVSSVTYAGTNVDYSTLITTTFTAGVTGTYEFEVGTDWGQGGATRATHVGSSTVIDELVTTNDIWWNNDWNDADVFSSVLNLTAGETYTIGWVGFEDCCGGNVSFRFSVNGSPPAPLDDTNFQPFEQATPVPEPDTALLATLGLAMLAFAGRRIDD